MRHRAPFSLTLLGLMLLAGCGSTPPPALPKNFPPPPPFPHPAPFQRVFVVVLENADAKEALQQPFLRELAGNGALLSQYSFVARPSQPNYLALTSGSTHNVGNNNNVNLDVRHLGNLLEENGKTWKSYAEDYPGDCFLEKSKGLYVRKHEPFLSYKNVQGDQERCGRVVNAVELDADIKAHKLPHFSLFIPNNRNNGHEPSDVRFADRWLKRTFGQRLKDRDFMEGMLFVVTFDESSKRRTVPVYTVLVGDSVQAGVTSDFPYNHYSLLRTIEEAFGLGTLGQEDATAVPIGGVWK
jgi:phosphoesterase family protein